LPFVFRPVRMLCPRVTDLWCLDPSSVAGSRRSLSLKQNLSPFPTLPTTHSAQVIFHPCDDAQAAETRMRTETRPASFRAFLSPPDSIISLFFSPFVLEGVTYPLSSFTPQPWNRFYSWQVGVIFSQQRHPSGLLLLVIFRTPCPPPLARKSPSPSYYFSLRRLIDSSCPGPSTLP